MIKITLILFIVCFSQLHSQQIERKISLKAENESLKSVLNKISGQTGVTFIYGDSIIKDYLVDFNGVDLDVEHTLQQILTPLNLSFKSTLKNQIVIFENPRVKKNYIAGYIIDSETFETLPYAQLSLKGMERFVYANSSGRFTLINIPDQARILSVDYIGYFSKDILLDSLLIDNEENVFIKLQQSVFAGDEIEVNVKSNLINISENVSQFAVSSKDFSNLPILGDLDLTRSLQLFPGISAANFGSSGLNIRGGLPSQNLILLDGIRLFHTNHLLGVFSAFNSGVIKNVQVYKGGHPAKFGETLSGVVELTSKNGDLNQPGLNFSLSQAVSGVIVEVPLFGKGSLMFSGRSSNGDFIYGSHYDHIQRSLYSKKLDLINIESDSADYIDSKSDFYFYDLMGKLTWLPSDHDILTISYYKSADRLKNKELVNHQAYDWKRTKSGWGNTGYSLKWYRQWHNKINSILNISNSDYFTDYSMTDNSYFFYFSNFYGDTLTTNSKIFNNVKNLTIQNDNQWHLSHSHLLEFGASISTNEIVFQLQNEYLDFANLMSEEFLNDDEFKQSGLYSFYLQDTWGLRNDLKLVTGLRINSYLSKIYPEQRISLIYNLSQNWSFSAASGRYYQFIMQYGDGNQVLDGRTSWIIANGKEIKPSYADHLISGVTYQDEGFIINTEGFYKKTYNIPDALNEWQYLHSDLAFTQMDGRIYGIDLFIQKISGHFDSWAGYSYGISENKITSAGGVKYFQSDNDVRHSLNIVTIYKMHKWQLSANWNYSSGRPYSIPVMTLREAHQGLHFYYLAPPVKRNNNRLKATHQLDLNINYNFDYSWVKGKAGISIFDLYNQQNMWYRDYTIHKGELQQVKVKMFGFTPTLFLNLNF
jgi:hypothetical protein